MVENPECTLEEQKTHRKKKKKNCNLKLKTMNLRAIARAAAAASTCATTSTNATPEYHRRKKITKSINSITFHSIFNKSQMAKSRQKKRETLCDLKIFVLE